MNIMILLWRDEQRIGQKKLKKQEEDHTINAES